jgi:hypothetical protein
LKRDALALTRHCERSEATQPWHPMDCVAPRRPPGTGSPATTPKLPLAHSELSENALAVMRWQPVQWQAMVNGGSSLTRNRMPPRRHSPV